ncbi:MAG: Inter-alpha-trypsin inhibitor domain protein [Myxococcales bacterium]|nr:Inter-alpha-trypsin inhibitor domain protein [Myxococcales bacterium]
MLLQLPSSSRVSSLLPTTPEGASSGAELVTSDGRSLSLVSAQLRGEAQGGIARLVLEQRFENTYDENLHVTYRMPLPADGAISGYAFVIADRTITGVVDRKAAARERFEQAVASGKTAALLEQERADIFTQQIGNIPPNQAVVAKITIDQRLVWLPEGEWELRFPTVIGPRYIGLADTAADVRATHIKVTDRPLTAGIQIEMTIRDAIVGGSKPSSPSHALEKRADGVIELRSKARLDRDIVMRWRVATPTVGISLDAARIAEQAYGLLTLVPPARGAATAVARDLIVLLDTSGSMGGGPLDKAKQVVAMLIDSLGETDRLELIEFSNQPRRYLEEPVLATARAKQDAIRWVRSRKADGGTEMRAGVIEALQTLRVGAQRQVVVVTDGYVGGEQQILAALHERLPKSCRLHVLGVGSAVNRSLATSLARAGRGAEVIVGIDEDAERGAKRLLDRTQLPMLTNVEISGSALLRHAPAQLPDVFEGAPLVAALALRPEGGELVVRGQLARETWEQTIAVPANAAGEGNQAIAALYGRERVADVEAHAMFSSVDGEIEDLGLTFQIATRLTSWVAIDDSRRVTGPSTSELIPQELPYGTSVSAFGLRGAAAAAPAMASMMFGESAAEETTGGSQVRTRGGLIRSARPAPPQAYASAPRAPGYAGGPPPREMQKRAKGESSKDAPDESRTTGEYEVSKVVAPQQVAPSTTPPAASEPAAQPAPPSAPRQQALGQSAPPQIAPSDKPRRQAVPESAPQQIAPSSDRPRGPVSMTRIEEPKPVVGETPQARKTAPIWPYLLAALLIAALMWWFLR